jgi:capsular exopolysaccharide synthesis family protein
MPRVIGRHRTSFVDLASHATDPFRELRLALELRHEARTGNMIMFTSPSSGDGKSTLAANYALVAAHDGLRVLLVDADLRSPSLHEFFDHPRAPGLLDLLGSEREIAEFVHPIVAHEGRLELLTAGSPVSTSGHVASSSAMAALLEKARWGYDAVVVDSPAALASADASGLASHHGNDIVVVVNPSGRRSALTRTLRKLELTGANVVGLVVNNDGAPVSYG